MIDIPECHLDLGRMEKVRFSLGKIKARCPACAENGADRRGEHLVIFPDGKFACAAHAGDPEHRRRIWELRGQSDESFRSAPGNRNGNLWQRRERPSVIDQGKNSVQAARTHRAALCERFRWDFADVWEDSPVRLEGAECDDPRWFLSALFPRDALLWSGEVWHSGRDHADHWRTTEEWARAECRELGPMVTPAIWRDGTVNRSADNVFACPFVVLDFDGLPGRTPRTTEELREHQDASLGIIRLLREGLYWKLAAILHTGSKSLHAWFHHPGKEALESSRGVVSELGIDEGLIDHPEHPARLPGQVHKKTGLLSRLLWLSTADH